MLPSPFLIKYSPICPSTIPLVTFLLNMAYLRAQESSMPSRPMVEGRMASSSKILSWITNSCTRMNKMVSPSAAQNSMVLSQKRCVREQTRKVQAEKKTEQNLRNMNCTPLSMISMRQWRYSANLSLKQMNSSSRKHRNIMRGLSKVNRIMKEKILNRMMSLNSMGKRGYWISRCRIFWHPIGFPSSCTCLSLLFHPRYMRSKQASRNCTTRKLKVELVMMQRILFFSASFSSQALNRRQKVGMMMQQMKWNSTVVSTTNRVRLVWVFGRRISDSLSINLRKLIAMGTRAVITMLAVMAFQGQGRISRLQTTFMQKKSSMQEPANVAKKYNTDKTFSCIFLRQFSPRLFQMIQSGMGQSSQYMASPWLNPSKYLARSAPCSLKNYLTALRSFSVLNTTIHLSLSIQQPTSCLAH